MVTLCTSRVANDRDESDTEHLTYQGSPLPQWAPSPTDDARARPCDSPSRPPRVLDPAGDTAGGGGHHDDSSTTTTPAPRQLNSGRNGIGSRGEERLDVRQHGPHLGAGRTDGRSGTSDFCGSRRRESVDHPVFASGAERARATSGARDTHREELVTPHEEDHRGRRASALDRGNLEVVTGTR